MQTLAMPTFLPKIQSTSFDLFCNGNRSLCDGYGQRTEEIRALGWNIRTGGQAVLQIRIFSACQR